MQPTDPARLNARLDPASARRLAELSIGTGKTVSEVVREAIGVYHAQMVAARKGPARLIALAGTLTSGRNDLSTRFKALLDDSIAAKVGRAGPTGAEGAARSSGRANAAPPAPPAPPARPARTAGAPRKT
jgi:hypothetical protein